MRKVIYFAACSLDGFIEGANGALDWLMMTPEAGKVIEEFFPRVDTMLMGRRTWEFAAANGTGGAAESGMKTVVFSRTLERVTQRNTTLVRDNAAAFVRDLKAQPGKDIWLMGGGVLAGSLIAEGVVDELALNVHPVILGSGVPLAVHQEKPAKFELVESRMLSQGCVMMIHRPLPPARRTGRKKVLPARERSTAAI